MKVLWHHSRQRKIDPPIDSLELLRLVQLGLVEPTDWVRRKGSSHWVKAGKVKGLFLSAERPGYRPEPAEARAAARGHRVPERRPSETPQRPRRSGPTGRRGIRPLPFILPLAAAGTVVLVLTSARLPASRTSPQPSRVTGEKDGPRPNVPLKPGPGGTGPARKPVVDVIATPNPGRQAGGESPAAGARLQVRESDAEARARVGKALHALIVRFHEVDDDAGYRDRLDRAAAPLLRPSEVSGPGIRLTILKSDEVFTFSHPEDEIYVSRGLFQFVRNDAELQFHIARELAHLERNDLVDEVKRSAEGETDAPQEQRLYRQIALGYAADAVFAADERAFRTLRELGHPARKLWSWLSPSYDFNGAADPRGTRRRPALSPPGARQEVENHWRSHPPASLRFARLRALELTGAGRSG
jgi:hypothetical protein